jgi:hypothetical protein
MGGETEPAKGKEHKEGVQKPMDEFDPRAGLLPKDCKAPAAACRSRPMASVYRAAMLTQARPV